MALVLGLIFLKYISDSFEEQRKKLKGLTSQQALLGPFARCHKQALPEAARKPDMPPYHDVFKHGHFPKKLDILERAHDAA